MPACEEVILSSRVPDDIKASIMDAVERGDKVLLSQKFKEAREWFTKNIQRETEFSVKKKAVIKDMDDRLARGTGKESDVKLAGEELMGGAGVRQRTQGTSLDMDIKGQLNRLTWKLTDMLESIKPRMFFQKRSKQHQQEVWTALYDDTAKVSDVARDHANKIKEATDDVWKAYNDLGVPISHVESYGIPVYHDPQLIKDMGQDQWVRLINETMDLTRIEPSDGSTVDDVLRSMWDNITTQEVKPINDNFLSEVSREKHGRSFQKERYLQPASGKGYLEYIGKAGQETDPYRATVKYFDMVSRDLAAVRKFGPDHGKMVGEIGRHMVKKSGNNKAAVRMQNMYDHLMFRNLAGDPVPIAKVMDSARALMTMTKLTFTPVTALTDKAFENTVKAMNGYVPFIRIRRQLSRLQPGSLDDRQISKRIAVVMDDTLRYMSLENRFGELAANSQIAKWADMSTHVSGLQWWTNTMKRSATLDLLSTLGETTTRSRNFNLMLERYGITDADWKVIQNSTSTFNGIKFVDVSKMTDDAVINKTLSMMNTEMSFMVPELGTKARSYISMGREVGTWENSLAKMMTQFKGFTISVWLSHIMRAFDAAKLGGSQMLYGPMLLLTGTMMGTTANQLKEIAKGYEPQKLVNPDGSMNMKFWMDGLVASGMLPVIGNMILQDPTLYGGIAKGAVGPAPALAFDAVTAIIGPLYDEKTNKSMEKLWDHYRVSTLKGVEKHAFFNQLLYTRAAWNHSLGRMLHDALDPNARDKNDWLKKLHRKEGREDYWGSGRGAGVIPERLPDLKPW